MKCLSSLSVRDGVWVHIDFQYWLYLVLLGVNKRCSNVDCRNEIGRLPLQEIITIRIIKFLQDLPNNNIAKQCLEMCEEITIKNKWIIHRNFSNLNKRYNLPDTSSIISYIQWNKYILFFLKKIMGETEFYRSPKKSPKNKQEINFWY